MGFIERAIAAIGKINKKEIDPQPEMPKTVLEFAALLEKEGAGTVCVYPWKNLKLSEGGESAFEYGLDYFSESITSQPLFFQERFGRPKPSQDNNFRNKITAISRLKLIEELARVSGYMVKKPSYLADPIDPEIYPHILSDAMQRGVEPFPLPIPEVFGKTMDESTQMTA